MRARRAAYVGVVGGGLLGAVLTVRAIGALAQMAADAIDAVAEAIEPVLEMIPHE